MQFDPLSFRNLRLRMLKTDRVVQENGGEEVSALRRVYVHVSMF